MKKHRIFMFDIIRVVCAILIFMKYSITMFECTYTAHIDKLVSGLTSEVMTCFFMLSGFSLYYTYNYIDMQSTKEKIRFYKKRAIGILPAYYLVHVLWCLFMEDSLLKGIQLIPVELLGIQTIYNTLFGILHNGGTWFISCILICYFVYPLLQEIINEINMKKKIFLTILISFLLAYSYYLILWFGIQDIYTNPFIRGMEFTVGVLCASIIKEIEIPKGFKWNMFIVVIDCILILGLLYINYYSIIVHGGIWLEGIVGTPIIAIILSTFSLMRYETLEKSKILGYLSKISYYFYLLQLFLWKISGAVIEVIGNDRNRYKVGVSFICCVLLSVLIYELYDKPIQRKLRNVIK